MKACSKKERRQQFFSSIETALGKKTVSVEARDKLDAETKLYHNFSYNPEPLTDKEKLAQFKQFMSSQSAEIFDCKKDQVIEKIASSYLSNPVSQNFIIKRLDQ